MAILDNPLVDALVQTAFVTMASLNRLGAEHDLSLTQLRVLAILRDRRLQMSNLAAYLGLDRSTMSGMIGRAEQRGLVRRAANLSDGRAVDVLLTAKGSRLAAQLNDEIAVLLTPFTHGLGTAERRRLQTLLERMLAGA